MTDLDPNYSVRLQMTGFAKRLEERFGRSADPNISLEPEAREDTRPASDDDVETQSRKRLKRLENLTPAEFRYEYVDEVGRGGMGVVFKVRDRDLGRHLAMKVVSSSTKDSSGPVDQSKLTRFLEEAQITGQLDHPGIVPVHELGMDTHGRCFFTMRLVKGRDLKDVFDAIHQTTPVTDAELKTWNRNRALWAVHRVCETMAFAHSKGVIHRDLKPANIMVGRFGETYVMDWGLAKILGREDSADVRLRQVENASVSLVNTDRRRDSELDPDSPMVTMFGDVMGTPAYMAPEQAGRIMEKVGTQSDVYSIGAILYHLLTGRAPYTEPDQRLAPSVVLMKVLAGPPPRIHTLRKNVPVELAAICEKAMAYSRKKRYQTVLELADDLSAFLEGRVVGAYETGSIAEFRKWVERNKAFAGALACALIVLIAALSGISYLTATTNANLEDKNQELQASKLEAERNAERAVENERVADSARKQAVHNAEVANRQGYISHIRAANSSLRLDEINAALGHLAFTTGPYAGWEYAHLNLATDTSLKSWQVPLVGNQVAAVSPDGRTFAVLTNEPRHGIQLRSTETGAVLRTFVGHSQTITSLAFSNDGKLLASAARDRSTLVWETSSARHIKLPLIASVEDLAFSPLGRRLAIGTKGVSPQNGQLLLFDLGDDPFSNPPKQAVATFDAEGGIVQCVAFGPRGKRVVTGTSEGLVHIWDLATRTAVLRKEWTLSPVRSVGFASTGSTFVVATEDGVLRVASTDSGGIVAQRSMDDALANECAFLQDGRVLMGCTDGNLRLFNPSDTTLVGIHGHTDNVTALAVSDLGAIAITGANDGSLRLWSTYSLLAEDLVASFESTVRDLTYHPNGRTMAVATNDGPITLIDSLSGEVLSVLRGHKDYVPALAFSSSGRWLASGSGDKTVRIWDANKGEIFAVLEGHQKWVSDLAFSPEGRYLASASGDGSVRVWDVETEACLATFESDGDWIHCLNWDRAGTRLVSGGGDGVLRVWDPFREELVTTMQLSDRGILDVKFALDDNTVYAALFDGTVRVIDLRVGETNALKEHRAGVTSIEVAPDGKRIATADMNGSILIWDTSDWEPLMSLQTRSAPINSPLQRQVRNLMFSPDGKRLVASAMGNVFAWETTPPDERHAAKLAARSVVGMVDDLFGDFGMPTAVLENLRDNRDISGKLREAAIRAVTIASSDPESIAEQAWRILLDEDETDEAFQNAMTLAKIAAEQQPEDLGFRAALAAGKYRTKDFAGAGADFSAMLKTLEPTDARPEWLVFAAMTCIALGELEQANEQLTALEVPMTRPAWQARAGALYREALTLLDAAR